MEWVAWVVWEEWAAWVCNPITPNQNFKRAVFTKLRESIKKGYKPYVLFLTQIQGINNFRIAKDIDSTYYKEYLDAKKSGVNFLAYRCSLNSKEIKIEKKIKILDE